MKFIFMSTLFQSFFSENTNLNPSFGGIFLGKKNAFTIPGIAFYVLTMKFNLYLASQKKALI